MRISDWSSDVCSSDLGLLNVLFGLAGQSPPALLSFRCADDLGVSLLGADISLQIGHLRIETTLWREVSRALGRATGLRSEPARTPVMRDFTLRVRVLDGLGVAVGNRKSDGRERVGEYG